MTSQSVDRPVSPLRARMIEDMTVRGFGDKTRNVEPQAEMRLRAFSLAAFPVAGSLPAHGYHRFEELPAHRIGQRRPPVLDAQGGARAERTSRRMVRRRRARRSGRLRVHP